LIDEVMTQEQVLRRLAEHLDDAVLARLFPGQPAGRIRRLIIGLPPESNDTAPARAPLVGASPTADTGRGCCRLFTDGASRGNPGQAGAGAVLLDADGEELAARSIYLGTCTNNVAEYKALLLGLDEALGHGCTELAIALDSELIVRQIQGRYKVKNEVLLPLFQQVRERLDRFDTWSITHVPRTQNSRADQLANRGIDQTNG
jgi:ribonuclease HI/probable phosphoglycerate mutase